MTIIEEPIKELTGGYIVMSIKCSDGNTYTQDNLAKARGITQGTLSRRLIVLGWDHKDVLSKARIVHPKQDSDIDLLAHIPQGDLVHLGSKRRNNPWPQVSEIERQLWSD